MMKILIIAIVVLSSCLSEEYQYFISTYEYPIINGSCSYQGEIFWPCGYLEDATKEITSNSFPATNISIVLLPLNYSINGTLSLTFHFLSKITINFETLGTQPRAKVVCKYGDLSFYFFNASIVSVDSIEFYHCGKSKPVITVEDIYREVHLTDVMFTGSSYNFIKSSGAISEIHIVDCIFDRSTEDYGVAINSFGRIVRVAGTTFKNCAMGSLVLSSPKLTSNITITNCTFANNKARTYTEAAAAVAIYSAIKTKIYNCSFLNNSGGSALVARGSSSHYVLIQYSKFVNNTGKDGGAIAASSIHNLYILHSNFDGNSASHKGGAVEANTLQFRIIIINCSFYHNSGANGGALELEDINHVNITQSDFIYNNANSSREYTGYGGAIYLHQEYGFNILFTSIARSRFINNTATYGGSVYYQCATICLIDTDIIRCIFSRNKATMYGGACYLSNTGGVRLNSSLLSFNEATRGGSLYLIRPRIYVNKTIFKSNRACTGGALYSELSYIYLHDIDLDGNKALLSPGQRSAAQLTSKIYHSISSNNCNDTLSGKGGGIFIDDTLSDKGGGIFIDDQESSCSPDSCPLVWYNDSLIKTVNNSAKMGSVLFGGMITTCNKVSSQQNILLGALGNTNIEDAITSEPMYFCYIHDNFHPDCHTRILNKTVYLGQRFEVSVACLDQVMQTKQCNIKSEYHLSTKTKLGAEEPSRDIETFKSLTFHAYSKTETFAMLVMKSNIFCTVESFNTLEVYLQIEECPLGFEKITDSCDCDRRLKKYFETVKCHIDDISVTINENGWLGYDEKFLRIHKNCPLNYCTLTNDNITSYYPHSPCANNRGGIMCGQCIENYSLVVGSWKCKDCTGLYTRYSFIWLTVLFALVGVVLVVFLFLVKMTVSSGTTNGLILYANTLSVSGLLDYRNCTLPSVLRVLLSWINLDLGIEVCYYSGMDVYQKTWLQFVFPFYIWFLVGVIILFCHYSSRVMKLMGMRNIEVLATLFLLSYTKLLKTIVTSLSFTDLKVSNASNVSDIFTLNRVWLYDAHINYFSLQHLPLFIVATLFLVLLFIPYTAFLLFGQCLVFIPHRRRLNWIHSPVLSTILDAYFAPYKKNTRYWTGLGLVLRCVLFTLYGTSYSINNNVFYIAVSVILLLVFRTFSGGFIYRNKIIDIIEVFFIVNVGVVALILHHREEWCEALTVSASLSLIVFIGLFVFHVYSEIKKHATCPNVFQRRFRTKSSSNNSEEETNKDNNDKSPSGKRECNSVTYTELRESLLDN